VRGFFLILFFLVPCTEDIYWLLAFLEPQNHFWFIDVNMCRVVGAFAVQVLLNFASVNCKHSVQTFLELVRLKDLNLF